MFTKLSTLLLLPFLLTPGTHQHPAGPVDTEGTLPVYTVDARVLITNNAPFQSFPDRLQQTVQPLTQNITDAMNDSGLFEKHLINPGIARTVIIQPAEVQALAAVGITMKDIESVAFNNYIAYTIFSFGCIGRQTSGGEEVAYIETVARTWDNMRKDLEKMYKKKKGVRGGFVAANFHPHMTIGESSPGYFDDADVGVGSCVAGVRHEDPVVVGGADPAWWHGQHGRVSTI